MVPRFFSFLDKPKSSGGGGRFNFIRILQTFVLSLFPLICNCLPELCEIASARLGVCALLRIIQFDAVGFELVYEGNYM